MMDNDLARYEGGNLIFSPPKDAAVVTPSDSADLPRLALALDVRASGLVRVTTFAGTTLEVYCIAGAQKVMVVRRIHSTGTDAGVVSAGIVAFF